MPSSPLSDGDIEGLEPIDDVELTIPKSVVISVRLSREELDVFSDAAAEAGMKLSTFLKEAARGAVTQRPRPLKRVEFGLAESGYMMSLASATPAGGGVAHRAESVLAAASASNPSAA